MADKSLYRHSRYVDPVIDYGFKPFFMRLAEIAEYSALTEAQQIQYYESLDDYIAYHNSIERRERKAKEKGREEALKNNSAKA